MTNLRFPRKANTWLWRQKRVIVSSTEYGFRLPVLKPWLYLLPVLRSRQVTHLYAPLFPHTSRGVIRVSPLQDCCKRKKFLGFTFKREKCWWYFDPNPRQKRGITRNGFKSIPNYPWQLTQHYPSDRVSPAARETNQTLRMKGKPSLLLKAPNPWLPRISEL